MMSWQSAQVAIRKELRAVGPAWLVCLLALLVTASLLDADVAQDWTIAVYVFGATALGALSMGHEYIDGTLSLLLSQPRPRAHIVLLKLGVLVPALLTLGALYMVLGSAAPNVRGVVFVTPLLCGLFIAPWLTMLCRNPLGGIVFTTAVPGMLLFISQIAASTRFGTDPAAANASVAMEIDVLLWGMLAVSTVAAVSGWRLFMRLEAIDGPGQAIGLGWRRAGTPGTAAAPAFAKRRALWLLVKKELRLQQLSFVVSGLYVLGWLGIWAAKLTMPDAYATLLFTLTATNALAASLLAGSLASAEERQLGTLEWHTLLPAPARTQWAVKAGTAIALACVLGLAVPMAMTFLTGSREVYESMRPLLSVGVGYTVIFVTVVSLYVSSLCATSLQALLWSVATGFGLMTLTGRVFVLDLVRLELSVFNISWRFWLVEPRPWLLTLLAALSALSIATAAGVPGLLLRFAQANHCSAERNPRRVSRQLLSVAAFLVILLTLSYGVSSKFRVEAEAYSRDRMNHTWGFVTFAVTADKSRPIERYMVVVIPEESSRDPLGRPRRPYGLDRGRWRNEPKDTIFLPGRYSVVAVEPIAQSELLWDPEMIARLKAHTIPFAIAAGEKKALQLTLSTY